MMSERERLIENRFSYMVWGDLDKPFHRPECECDACEDWRKKMDRPTHAKLKKMPKQ